MTAPCYRSSEQGLKVLGVDPAVKIATAATVKGIPTKIGFFDETLAENIIQRTAKHPSLQQIIKPFTQMI